MLRWTYDELVDSFANALADFSFVGSKCCKCQKTVNVAHGAGWTCGCGEYNFLLFAGGQMPYEKPDEGPTRAELQAALEQAKKINPARFSWMQA